MLLSVTASFQVFFNKPQKLALETNTSTRLVVSSSQAFLYAVFSGPKTVWSHGCSQLDVCAGSSKMWIWFSTAVSINYPAGAPVKGTGYCNRSISLFVCLFVYLFDSLSAILRENGWTDLHEIFREGVEWPWDDLIQFWVNSRKRVGGSKVTLVVITGRSSESLAFARVAAEDWR